MPLQIVGVDPGLVDTGIVGITFYGVAREWAVDTKVVHAKGPSNKMSVQEIVNAVVGIRMRTRDSKLFVEEYRPRLKLHTDKEMLELQTLLRQQLKDATFLPNMGIKQLITSDFMKMLGVWNFPRSTTHHHDLRSAARIALLGGIKDDEASPYVNQFASNHLRPYGKPWTRIN